MSTAMTVTAPAPVPAAAVDYNAEMRAAGLLVKSGLVPRDIRTPEAALFCILAGRDLGLSAVQSLRCIRPVQGKLEVSADAQLGLFARAGGRFGWVALTDGEAALKLEAPWLTAPHVSRFTMEDAKRAGLTGDNWRKYPRAMLRSRAITAGLKDIGFLQGAGVYAPGEISGDEAVVVSPDGEVLVEAAPTPAEILSHATAEELATWRVRAVEKGQTDKADLIDAEIARRAPGLEALL